MEFHTLLPLLHWLPPQWFRAVLARTGHDFFASEENLNLLSKRRLNLLAAAAGISDRRTTAVRLFGWPTNLILAGRKQAGQ